MYFSKDWGNNADLSTLISPLGCNWLRIGLFLDRRGVIIGGGRLLLLLVLDKFGLSEPDHLKCDNIQKIFNDASRFN